MSSRRTSRSVSERGEDRADVCGERGAAVRCVDESRGDGARQGIHLKLEECGVQYNGYSLITNELSAIMLRTSS